MRRQSIRYIMLLGILVIIIFNVQPLFPIKWSHDYTYYCVTGENSDGKSASQLRSDLSILGYLPFILKGDSPLSRVTHLKRGDVVILGDKHSGCVDRKGMINHYVQRRVKGRLLRLSPGKISQLKNLYRGWSVSRMINFKQTYNPETGKKLTEPKYPFKDVDIQVWRKIDNLVVKPREQTVKVNETATFYIEAVFSDGTSLIIKPIYFKGKKSGVFAIQGDYSDRPATEAKLIVLDRPRTGRDCDKNEIWNEETGQCDCKEGYIRSQRDNRCKSIEEIRVELSQEGEDNPCAKDIDALFAEFKEMKANINKSYHYFTVLVNKFFQQFNSRVSNPCSDGILAYCYVSALGEAEIIRVLFEDLSSKSSDIIMTIGICNLSGTHSIESFLSEVIGVKQSGVQVQKNLALMITRLREASCDEIELKQLGDSVTAQGGVDPNFLQDGGLLSEIYGDGMDQDGDGLQDEGISEIQGYNVVINVFDTGNAKDDTFSLSVSGKGYLGTTPKGGLRSFGLNLPSGNYTASISVLSTDLEGGTFAIKVFHKGVQIASATGNAPLGGGGALNFTISQ